MDLSGVVFDSAGAISVGLLILTAVAAIWGVRKAIGMANR